jgi:broad specificity phosphatase PhoE
MINGCDVMEELFIIRHGQADHLLAGTVGGWSDTSLTDLGREQARRTGEKLKKILTGKEFNFYCSDLIRAKKTAEIIGKILSKEPKVRQELRELSNGLAANKSNEEAEILKIPISEPILDCPILKLKVGICSMTEFKDLWKKSQMIYTPQH